MSVVEDGRGTRPRHSQVFARSEKDHYVEPAWCSKRLFQEESFYGSIVDPACGRGTIVIEALIQGHRAAGFDLVERGWDCTRTPTDFLACDEMFDNIVTNPPFHILEQFIAHAVAHSRYRTAAILPLARMPAAHWLKKLPLKRIWLLTPRPSMPPGHHIDAGGKVGGGKADFCWLVFERGYQGDPQIGWLHRDAKSQATGDE